MRFLQPGGYFSTIKGVFYNKMKRKAVFPFYESFKITSRCHYNCPFEEYEAYIDFLHVSIDEGHDNLEMFDLLPELVKLQTQVSVQIVVTRDTVDLLEHKINLCYQAGANAVIIPAAPMSGAENCFPDIDHFGKVLKSLYQKYPNTIHTPSGYPKAYEKRNCSSVSVIIDVDGSLYYPCHILETKGPDLRTVDLNSWLVSNEAETFRDAMENCNLNCGRSQFYSIDSYLSPFSVLKSIKPMLLQHRKILSN